jgi:hypothetical protein
MLWAQPAIKHDTANVTIRSFNPASIKKFKEDEDFQYNRYKEPVKSLWDRFWDWFWFKVNQILQTKSGRTTVYTVLIILSVAALAYFIFKVLGMDGGKLFGRKAENGLDYSIATDNIHQISFDEAINDAISAGNFRLAVRLLYLQSLKKLSDKDLIDWKIDKTNSDYLQEIMNNSWHNVFRQLTNKFEWVWYGEMNINRQEFENLQVQFQQFNNQL